MKVVNSIYETTFSGSGWKKTQIWNTNAHKKGVLSWLALATDLVDTGTHSGLCNNRAELTEDLLKLISLLETILELGQVHEISPVHRSFMNKIFLAMD